MLSDFDAWFEAQFGKRQHPGAPSDTDLLQQAFSGEAAKRELDLRHKWDAQYRAALYARNAFIPEPPKED